MRICIGIAAHHHMSGITFEGKNQQQQFDNNIKLFEGNSPI
jgi:hypothetical protein